MKLNTKQYFQIVLSLGAAIWIFWFLYKDISWGSIKDTISRLSFFWLGLSILVSVLGFWLRAWRWRLLLEADKVTNLQTGIAFQALMAGYLVNLLVPRAGEIVRCTYLSKTENIPIGKLFGTVVLERTIDLLFMGFLIILAFFIERGIFVSLFSDLVSIEYLFRKVMLNLPIIIGGFLITALFVYWIFQKYRDSG